MGPNSRFWSQKSHFGLILFLKGEMLKSPNEENEGFCPTADPPLSHCQPTTIFRYLLVFQRFSYFWSHFLINFYKLMYAGMQKYSWNMQKILHFSRQLPVSQILITTLLSDVYGIAVNATNFQFGVRGFCFQGKEKIHGKFYIQVVKPTKNETKICF